MEGLTATIAIRAAGPASITQLIALLSRATVRAAFIVRGIVHLAGDRSIRRAKNLPTEWLGEHSADMVTDAVNTLLDGHGIAAIRSRRAFDRATFKN